MDSFIHTQIFAILPSHGSAIADIGVGLRVIGEVNTRRHPHMFIAVKQLFFFKPEVNALFKRQSTPKIKCGFAFLGGVESFRV